MHTNLSEPPSVRIYPYFVWNCAIKYGNNDVVYGNYGKWLTMVGQHRPAVPLPASAMAWRVWTLSFTSEHKESSSSYVSASRELRLLPLKRGKLGTGKLKSS